MYATKSVPKKLDDKLTPSLPFKAPALQKKVNLNHSDSDGSSADDEESQMIEKPKKRTSGSFLSELLNDVFSTIQILYRLSCS